MLSKPNVNDLIEKAGNRYEAALAIAKRARNIAQKRLDQGDNNIKDAVDLAATEIYEEKAFVKINGEYVLKNKDEEVDMDEVISTTVEGILKDLAVDEEVLDLEKPKKVRKTKKDDSEKVADNAEDKATATKKKKATKDE